MKLRLSDRARADLDDIRAYTIETFGVRQWLVYGGALDQGFSSLLRFPELGREHEALPRGYRALRIREHWICYRISGEVILIDGIVKYVVMLRDE